MWGLLSLSSHGNAPEWEQVQPLTMAALCCSLFCSEWCQLNYIFLKLLLIFPLPPPTHTMGHLKLFFAVSVMSVHPPARPSIAHQLCDPCGLGLWKNPGPCLVMWVFWTVPNLCTMAVPLCRAPMGL